MLAKPPAGLEESDFETIEDAVLETARGRWFLREFARRARASDTSRLLDAIGRIENLLSSREGPEGLDFEQQARALDERHQRLAEIAWMLRERGYDGDICALIEKEARSLGRIAASLRAGGALAESAQPPQIAPALAISAPIEPEPEIAAPTAAQAPELAEPEALAPLAAPPDRFGLPLDWRERAIAALAPLNRLSTRERLALCA